MAIPRIMVEERLAAGATFALTEAQARHVGTVLRLEFGDELRVFNAKDGEWRARIVEKSKRGMGVRVEDVLRAARVTPDLNLLFAPVKRHATDLIIEKATELGVRSIRPVITQRTIAETVRLDRLNAIAREAAEQTERFDAPEIWAPVSLAKVLDGWDASRALIFCDETGEAAGLLEMLQTAQHPLPLEGGGAGVGVRADTTQDELIGQATTLSDGAQAPHPEAQTPHPLTPSPSRGGGTQHNASSELSLLIGPEGGFTPEERAMLRAYAFVMPVSLGPRILRAETAAIAALSIIQAAWGDWRA